MYDYSIVCPPAPGDHEAAEQRGHDVARQALGEAREAQGASAVDPLRQGRLEVWWFGSLAAAARHGGAGVHPAAEGQGRGVLCRRQPVSKPRLEGGWTLHPMSDHKQHHFFDEGPACSGPLRDHAIAGQPLRGAGLLHDRDQEG